MASEKNNYSDSSSEDTMDRESEKLNDDNNGIGRSYECNFCKRGFTNAQALGGHMNIHRKDKLKAKQNNSHHQESSKLSKEVNYAFDNSRYYASPISSHDELQQHNYSRAQMNSYQFHHFQLPQNPSYQHVYNHHDHHDDSRLRHDNYYDANNLSLRIGPTLINDDDEERGGKKDVDESELDLELRLGYNNH